MAGAPAGQLDTCDTDDVSVSMFARHGNLRSLLIPSLFWHFVLHFRCCGNTMTASRWYDIPRGGAPETSLHASYTATHSTRHLDHEHYHHYHLDT